MNNHIYRDISEPILNILDYEIRINGPDQGIINAWEVGRERAKREPELVEMALNGELPDLGLKGGVTGNPKKKTQYGCLWYLAQWQGLRGDNLDIHIDKEVDLVCSRTGVKVTFTSDLKKYASLQD